MTPMKFTVDDILRATHGLLGQGYPSTAFAGVFSDTRQLVKDSLFVALRGERFDGHAFLAQAVEAGAAGVVIEREATALPPSVAVVQVNDTLKALGDIASFHRRRFNIPVVAVTGSVGKTTTKEFIAAALSRNLKTIKARESFNNEVGVPLALLELEESHEAIVLEFAMRGLGQIRYLTEIANPTVGVITNIGESHIGVLGSVEAIAQAKGELVTTMTPDGLAVLNADDPWFSRIRAWSRSPVVSYGARDAADYGAEDVSIAAIASEADTPDLTTEFTAKNGTGSYRMRLPVCGRHFVSNALAAVAVARRLGLEFDQIALGLQDVDLPKMRQQWIRSPRGCLILNDAYNSSPASLRAALEVVHEVVGPRRRIAVLGDIKELGDDSNSMHYQLGTELKSHDVEILVCAGEFADALAAGASAGGLADEQICKCEDAMEATAKVTSIVQKHDIVLVKASRAMHFETVVEGLTSEKGRQGVE